MMFQIGAQRATGDIGRRRTGRAISACSRSATRCRLHRPADPGFSIDHYGHAAPFAVLAVVALLPVAVLAADRFPLPVRIAFPMPAPRRRAGAAAARDGAAVLAVNVLLSVGWDLHTVFVPIYGARIGLTASEIGMVLSAFAAATSRAARDAGIARRLTEHQVLTAALFVAGGVYLVFPFSQSAVMLGALSFCVGLGLGSGQPMVMSLLHLHSPRGASARWWACGCRWSSRRRSWCRCCSGGRILARPGAGVLVGGVCLAAGGYLTRADRAPDAGRGVRRRFALRFSGRRNACGTWPPSARRRPGSTAARRCGRNTPGGNPPPRRTARAGDLGDDRIAPQLRGVELGDDGSASRAARASRRRSPSGTACRCRGLRSRVVGSWIVKKTVSRSGTRARRVEGDADDLGVAGAAPQTCS